MTKKDTPSPRESSVDPFRISDAAELREVVGDTLPGVETKLLDRLDSFAMDYLSKCPFLVLSTSNEKGELDASPKGDAPGFVLVKNERTVVIPDRPGNRLIYGHLNILANPRIGLLCMIPGTPETLRINGRAELTRDPTLLAELAARGKPAVLAIRIHIDECFFHCAKAFIRSNLWKPEKWATPHRVSFGEMFAAQSGMDEKAARKIDEAIATDYETGL